MVVFFIELDNMTEKINNTAKPQIRGEGMLRLRGWLGLIGRILIGGDLSAIRERTPLPEGFRYADPRRLKSTELGGLWRQIKGQEDVPEDLESQRRAEAKKENAWLIEVAVRDRAGKLAGYGSVFCCDEEGEMRNFVVHPTHQGRGVGKAIILERLRIADQCGVGELYVPPLMDTNTLRTFYLENGFSKDPDSEGMIRTAPPQQDR